LLLNIGSQRWKFLHNMSNIILDGNLISYNDIKENTYYIDEKNGLPGEILKTVYIEGDLYFCIVLCDNEFHIGFKFPVLDYDSALITLTGKALDNVMKILVFK